MAVKPVVKGFSVTQICRIIKECRKNGVISFKLGELALDFKELAEKAESNMPSRREQRVNEKELGSVYTASEDEDMHDEQLLIDDPIGFEEQQIDRLVGNSRDGNETKEDRRA